MSRGKENILESNIHFIILGVAGLISLGLLYKFVITSPSSEEFMGQRVTPANVDSVVEQHARRIEERLQSEPEPAARYTTVAPEFEAILQDAMPDLRLAFFNVPNRAAADTDALREYSAPQIPAPTEMAAAKVRTVAHVPATALTRDDDYESVDTNPADIDIVTVQAKIDVTSLYENFERAFAGRSIRAEWRDPQLARVVFAGTKLQRQELVDGEWTEWQTVERPRIDRHRQTFNDIYTAQDASRAEVFMPRFLSPQVWRQALQPRMYDIARLDMDWYPPSIFPDYVRRLEEQERQRQREEREAARDAATADRRRPDTRQQQQRTTAPRTGTGDMMGDMGGDMGMGGGGMGGGGFQQPRQQTRQPTRTREDPRQQQTRDPREPERRDFDAEYEDMRISEDADLTTLRGEIAVWAHDDTVEPGKTYRYRLSYGVFNPVAGRNWYDDDSAQYNDEIVLWSDFTNVTDSFTVDRREYLFPTTVRGNGVVVRVAKLMLGNWRTREFFVNPGEFIGYEVEEEVPETTTVRYNRDRNETVTENIDYSTGAIFLDLMDIRDWELAGSLNQREYQSMVYTKDDMINSIPTRNNFWPSYLLDAQRMISAAPTVEVSTDRRTTGMRRTPTGTDRGGMDMMPDMGMDMMGEGMMF